MKAKDLEELLLQKYDPDDSWGGLMEPYEAWGRTEGGVNGFYHDLYKAKKPIKVDGIGTFTNVESSESYTEMGDIDAVLVFKFKPEVPQETLFDDYSEKHFRITGSLDSWMGGPWDGQLREVKPVEVTITKWEQV